MTGAGGGGHLAFVMSDENIGQVIDIFGQDRVFKFHLQAFKQHKTLKFDTKNRYYVSIMKILVLGSNGMIGSAICGSYRAKKIGMLSGQSGLKRIMVLKKKS